MTPEEFKNLTIKYILSSIKRQRESAGRALSVYREIFDLIPADAKVEYQEDYIVLDGIKNYAFFKIAEALGTEVKVSKFGENLYYKVIRLQNGVRIMSCAETLNASENK